MASHEIARLHTKRTRDIIILGPNIGILVVLLPLVQPVSMNDLVEELRSRELVFGSIRVYFKLEAQNKPNKIC